MTEMGCAERRPSIDKPARMLVSKGAESQVWGAHGAQTLRPAGMLAWGAQAGV